MKGIFQKLRYNLMYLKQYIHRTIGYVSILNSGMILFLFLSKLKELGFIHFDLESYFFVIFTLGFLFLLFLGWVEIKWMKGIQQEHSIIFNLNPELVDMKKKIDGLYNHHYGKLDDEENNNIRWHR